jgi:tRNA(fMet)-specific endonuclease VapC
MYLLDSCTMSDFMKGDNSTLNKIQSTSPSLIYTSTITQTEITYGLLRKFEKSHRYYKILEDFLSVITIVSFDQKSATEAAIIRKDLERAGQSIGAYDILIAGIAKTQGLVLVTSNLKEFQRISDLEIENWRN